MIDDIASHCFSEATGAAVANCSFDFQWHLLDSKRRELRLDIWLMEFLPAFLAKQRGLRLDFWLSAAFA